MPPPVASPTRRTRARPARRHPRRRSPRHRTRRPGPVDVARARRRAGPGGGPADASRRAPDRRRASPRPPGSSASSPAAAPSPASLATAAVAAFFRNPHRVPPSRTGVVLSPADGTVALVSEVVPPPELDLPRVPAPRVSVFLSVLDVHVQRIPADGRVVDVQYRHGRFLSADLDKASEDNERNALLLETVDGARVGVVQIAGPAGPADPLRRRPGRRGGGGGDLRTDPVRFAGRHLPAGGLDGHRRGRAAHDRRRDGACATPGACSTPGRARTRGGLTAVPSSRASVRLLPNAVTVLALCSGLSAVNFALAGRFDLCVAAIAAAAVFDALDGGLARLLDASSKIGAELDSLSDLVAFGVSPALLFYIWRLDGNRLGWVVALVFAVCMALRLARFNTLIDAEQRWPFAKEFFVGVPAPAAALVGGLPLLLWLQLGDGWWSAPLTVGLWALFAALLMVSRLPTHLAEDGAGADAPRRPRAGAGRAGVRAARRRAVPRDGRGRRRLPAAPAVHDLPLRVAQAAPRGVGRADPGAPGRGSGGAVGATARPAVAAAAPGRGGCAERGARGFPAGRAAADRPAPAPDERRLACAAPPAGGGGWGCGGAEHACDGPAG